jgi:hypothetical protein
MAQWPTSGLPCPFDHLRVHFNLNRTYSAIYCTTHLLPTFQLQMVTGGAENVKVAFTQL